MDINTYFGVLSVKFMSAGSNNVSSTSTMSTSPDCISAVPSHDIIIGIQSDPVEQFSGVCKEHKKKTIQCELRNEQRKIIGIYSYK